MKKSYQILIIVVILFLISVGLCYFAFIRYNKSSDVENTVVGQPENGFNTEASIPKIESSEDQIDIVDKGMIEDKEVRNDEKSVIKYQYRSNFRDPFQSYGTAFEKSSSQYSLKDIREMVSFELKGIISVYDKKIAIIDTADKTRLITVNDMIDEFKVLEIGESALLMSYQGWQFTIEMGSELDGDI